MWVPTGGKPLSVNSLFEVLEKIDRDFDEAGNPNELSVVAHPERLSSISKVISQAEADPNRYQAIMERKKEEWRARESNRKLVG